MKTPLSYFGGKQSLVSEIVPMMPYAGVTQFVSLFTGGAAIEFEKPKHDVEVWNDLNGDVMLFWRTMANNFWELSSLIKKTYHSEGEYKRALEILGNKDAYRSAEVAWAVWVQCNMSFGNAMFNGLAIANDNSRTMLLANKRERMLLPIYNRLRLVQFFNRDALDLIKLKDYEDTLFYADPPYVDSTCKHYEGYTIDDFRALLEALSGIKGRFILSSYPSELLNEFVANNGWRYREIDMHLSINNKPGDVKKGRKTECITWNYQEVSQMSLF